MLWPTADLNWSETVLTPQARVTKGAPDAAPDGPLETRILLGGPVCRPLNDRAVADTDVAATLIAEQDVNEYTLIDLGATFNPAAGEVVQRAWVGMELSTPGGGDTNGDANSNPPIAWSMTPQRRSTPVSSSAQIEIKADLKVVSVGATSTHGGTREEISLLALNLLRSDPMWEFTRTRNTEIAGSERLVMMVRSPAGHPVHGRLNVIALIGRRRLKAIPYNVLLSDGEAPTFTVR